MKNPPSTRTGYVFAVALLIGVMTASTVAARPLQRLVANELELLYSTRGNAFGLNARGQVVGCDGVPGNFMNHALRWDPDGDVVALQENSGATWSVARSINNEGVAVGESGVGAHGHYYALKWNVDGSFVVLNEVQGAIMSSANHVNDEDQAVGSCIVQDADVCDAVMWNSDGSLVELQPLPGDTYCVAQAINNEGQVVGYSGGSNMFGHAVMWTPEGEVRSIETLQGVLRSMPTDINDRGEVVGFYYLTEGYPIAFMWTQQRGMVSLGLPSSEIRYSEAISINNKGQIVGFVSNTASGQSMAIFNLDGTVTALSGLPGSTFSQGYGINANGQIVGNCNGKPVVWR